LNPPNKSEPSIIAWGLNHVIAKQTPIVFRRELLFKPMPFDIWGWERIIVKPIKITSKLPAKTISPFNTGKVLIRIPTPKKQASAREISKIVIINVTARVLFVFSRAAVFIKYRF